MFNDSDLDYIRRQFPQLEQPTVLMDNAGGSVTLQRVADRVRDHLLTRDVQLGASYSVSAKAARCYAEARARLAEFIHAQPDEVVFGPSTTILLKLLANAIASRLAPGDEIIVSRVDHEANISCWLALERFGARIVFWERNQETSDLALEDFEALLSPKTKLVCVTHVSNILGRINPVAEICERARSVGAWTCIDGVAYAPHRAIDANACGADFYAFSLYKTYGPHHAVLYCRKDSFLDIGGANHFFFEDDQIPGKLEPGNANYELSWGSAGIVDYFEDLGQRLAPTTRGASARKTAWDAIANHEQALGARLLDFLTDHPDIEIVGPSEASADVRVPTISFVHRERSSSSIVTAVDAYDIGIRFGHFYAIRLIEDMGLAERDGVVRVSLVHYNTQDEVDRLISAFEEVLSVPEA